MRVLQLFQAVVVLGVFVVLMRRTASSGARAAAGRSAELMRWADANGWTYQASDPWVPRLKVRKSSILASSEPSDVLRGTVHGLPVVAFSDWTSVGGTSTPLYVVALRLPVAVPYLQVTPLLEDRWVGGRGVEVRLELGTFDEVVEVRTDDPRYAHAVLHPRLMERILVSSLSVLVWRTEGDWIWTWDLERPDGGTVARRGAQLADIVASVPRHVWDDSVGGAPVVAPAPTWVPEPDVRRDAADL